MRIPVVAIVGRPNVGKSTLFNRIIGYRKAIVDDKEGITRDRHYAEADWNGRYFTVIDTGGYLPSAKEVIDKAVSEQVELAIDEADVVIFVVDTRAGITELDQSLANILRNKTDKVVLAANKVDNEKWESEIFQFYKLGVGDPFPVSAIQGRQSGDLLDAVVSKLPDFGSEEHEDELFNLAVIGKENVGKSSFVNIVAGENRNIVTDIPGTTRDSIDSVIKYRGEKIRIVDTAGLKRRSKIKENILFYSTLRTISAIERSEVVAYFFDANEGLAHYDVRMIQEIVNKGKGLLLVANKWDKKKKDHQTLQLLEKEFRKQLGQMNYLPFIFTSMTEKQRVGKLIEKTVEIFHRRNFRVPTSELNSYFEPIIAKTPPPAQMGKYIKIKYITQLRVSPPVIAFFVNHPKLIVEHYKRFLENKLREKFPFTGVPVQIVFKAK
jgi:GTP-binding protein